MVDTPLDDEDNIVKFAMGPKREGQLAKHRFVEVDCIRSEMQPGFVPVPIRLTSLVRSVLTMECRFPCNITDVVTAMVADSTYWSLLHDEWSPSFDGTLWYKALLAEIMKKTLLDYNGKKLTTSKAEEMLEDHNAVIASFYGANIPTSKIEIPVEPHLLALFLMRDIARFDGSPFHTAYEYALLQYLGYVKSGETCVAGEATVPCTFPSYHWPMKRWEDLVSPPTDQYDGIEIFPNRDMLNSRPYNCHYMVSMVSSSSSYSIQKPSSKWYIQSFEIPPTPESILKIGSDLGKFMVGRGGLICQNIVPVPPVFNEVVEWIIDRRGEIQDEVEEELGPTGDVTLQAVKDRDEFFSFVSGTILRSIFVAVALNYYPPNFGGTKWYKDAIHYFVMNSTFSNELVHGHHQQAIEERARVVARHLNTKPFSEVYCLLVKVLDEVKEEFHWTSMISDTSAVLRSIGIQHGQNVDGEEGDKEN